MQFIAVLLFKHHRCVLDLFQTQVLSCERTQNFVQNSKSFRQHAAQHPVHTLHPEAHTATTPQYF
jgi:hypothetical protein